MSASNDDFRLIMKYTDDIFNKKWSKLLLTEIEDIVNDEKVKTKISTDFKYSDDIPKNNIKYNKALILDPFIGSGTTAIVCKKYNRDYVGIELNNDYCNIANNRIKKT